MTDEDIIRKLWPNKTPLLRRYLNTNSNWIREYVRYLESRFSDSSSMFESLNRIKYHLEEKPRCKNCGKPLEYVDIKGGSWPQYCCCKCANSNDVKKQKTINTLVEKYGVKNSYNIRDVVERTRQKNLEKWNVEVSSQREDVREKISNSWKSHTEDQKKSIADKKRETCIERYGCENPYQNEEVKKRYRETCLAKYGFEHYSKNDTMRMKISQIISSKPTQQKIYNTKKRNNTFHTSKLEDKSCEMLREKFGEVIRQYRDERYPFACDFYIPSMDTFIECNYHWTHGGHAFDPSSDGDAKKLELWKSRGTAYYMNAIHTWTVSDVKKAEAARNAKIGFAAFYTIRDLERWLSSNAC